ncbi:transposase [Kitasatospora sp. NPDC057692]|uniref:transposase n=1 Tax=Kitasatospora sp. NPDC057692 TaxID=3346215 RepID=UPI0036B0DCE9
MDGPRATAPRQLLDAIRYLVAGGIPRRAMPADFPAWVRVYACFRRSHGHGLITGGPGADPPTDVAEQPEPPATAELPLPLAHTHKTGCG